MSGNWQQRLEDERPPAWRRAASILYGVGWRFYETWYDLGFKRRTKPVCKIMGIGNLTVGGTGKTPFVIELVKRLEACGKRVVVSCNGYGGTLAHEVTLVDKLYPSDQIGEEAALVRQALNTTPVVVGRRRLPAAQAACEQWKPDLIILDDGFQHLPLARDLDLVLLDAAKPFGNGYLLPAGPMREPASGLRRASAVLLIGESRSPDIPIGNIPTFSAQRTYGALVDAWTGDEVGFVESGIIALSGIGRPSEFEAVLHRLCPCELTPMRFADHHAYRQTDVEEAVDLARADHDAVIVTTEKDWIKLSRLTWPKSPPVLLLPMRIVLDDPAAFMEWLESRLLGG